MSRSRSKLGPAAEPRVLRRARGVIAPALIVTAAAALVFVLALIVAPERALFSYLAAYAYGLSIALGALFMVLIAHATNARWFVVIRRLAESVAATLPLFALLLLPVLLGMARLYPWVPPVVGFTEPELEAIGRKAAYLNVPFFLIRAIVYFAVWTALAWALRQWSLRQDRDPDAAPAARAVRLSGPGLVAAGVTMTFAAVDWLMSLDPTWLSTIFGVYWFSGGMYGGLAALTLLTWGAQRADLIGDEVAEGHYYALGRLLLVFTIFWAYIAFSQGFLIYIADLPREVGWYLDRLRGGWGVVLIILAIGHFLLPFAALLSYRLKQQGPSLAVVAAWMLLMHYIDMFWLVVPALARRDLQLHWVDPAALLLVTAPAVAFGAWRLAGHSVVAWRDPRIATSIDYRRE